jgi:hypothetical protein
VKPILYRLKYICPGGRHAWFESSVGLIRKPIKAMFPKGDK